ncbi:hypothetical protein CYLTODRAFT_292640 [Cylindrobasidium torrendii FP15055 ss-10]|uniref:Uncharacterized protein n=1 Tax=Cylindrobasidium torrendii FP15055 ss-10 TaxID=1314674 RepID=A0A0D7ATL8_9AGAR|nr:hypothetical protein CYLTODRAFT_292640 [Cylindrobasidium torrendii FP15055 ss-10]
MSSAYLPRKRRRLSSPKFCITRHTDGYVESLEQRLAVMEAQVQQVCPLLIDFQPFPAAGK